MTKNKIIFRTVQVFGLCCSGIGGLTVCGYIAGNPNLYTWSGSQGMALNTAIIFILQGVCLYIIGHNMKQK
jgi:hypothetical protein